METLVKAVGALVVGSGVVLAAVAVGIGLGLLNAYTAHKGLQWFFPDYATQVTVTQIWAALVIKGICWK